MEQKVDYGIDAPKVIRNFYLSGILMCLASWGLSASGALGALGSALGSILIWWGGAWIVSSSLMVLYAKVGKFNLRDELLKMVEWRGDETVLDIGTGRGLLMIGAAKRLTTGKAFGIDIWSTEDLSNNKLENTLRNVAAEGVMENTEIKSEDVRKLSFPDRYFDVILSNLCIHNLYKPEERRKACEEVARVLKPGGIALISDFRHTQQYVQNFTALGLSARRIRAPWRKTFFNLHIVEVRK